ncbi:MAG: hypothetical protein Q4E57_08520 [Eubacteriales bacterium]|nr:hypothetical protein [Eubacteriales bacterium]
MEDISISNNLIKPSALDTRMLKNAAVFFSAKARSILYASQSEIHPLHKPAVYDKRISSSGGPPGAHCVRGFPAEMHMQLEEVTLTGKEIIFAKAFIYQS